MYLQFDKHTAGQLFPLTNKPDEQDISNGPYGAPLVGMHCNPVEIQRLQYIEPSASIHGRWRHSNHRPSHVEGAFWPAPWMQLWHSQFLLPCHADLWSPGSDAGPAMAQSREGISLYQEHHPHVWCACCQPSFLLHSEATHHEQNTWLLQAFNVGEVCDTSGKVRAGKARSNTLTACLVKGHGHADNLGQCCVV